MKMNNKLSKFYDKEVSEEMIRNRYKNCLGSIKFTLERILLSKEFQNLKNLLRQKGWKDWHILLAIDNLMIMYRMNKEQIKTPEEAKVYSKKFLKEEQKDDIKVPLSIFTEENLHNALRGSMLSTLKLLGFSIPLKTIDMQKIEIFLKEKFNYFEDDIEHSNIFDLERIDE